MHTNRNAHDVDEAHVYVPPCPFPPQPVTNPSFALFSCFSEENNRPCQSFLGDKDGCGRREGGGREGREAWSDARGCWALQEKLWRTRMAGCSYNPWQPHSVAQMADLGSAWCQLSTGSGANLLGSVTTPVDSTGHQQHEHWLVVSDPGKAWVRRQSACSWKSEGHFKNMWDRVSQNDCSLLVFLWLSPSPFPPPPVISPPLLFITPPSCLSFYLSNLLCIYASRSFTLSRHRQTPNQQKKC